MATFGCVPRRGNTDQREMEIEQYKNILMYMLTENILTKIEIISV